MTARNFYGEPVPINRCSAEAARPDGEAFYLLSRERSNGTAHWWKPNHRGYTSDLNEAGLYGEAEAQAIQRDSNGGDIAFRASLVNTLLTVRRVVDMTEPRNASFFLDAGHVPG